MEDLLLRLKKEIIQGLNLNHLKVKDISNDTPLFDGGLELDSLDALELVFLIEKNYNLKILNQKEARKILISVQTIANYIISSRK